MSEAIGRTNHEQPMIKPPTLVAFAFAYKLFQELDVPIGMLNCSQARQY